jgi:hypothetical protein
MEARKRYQRYFEDQPIDIQLKPNPTKAEVLYGKNKKSLGTIDLNSKFFDKGTVVKGKEQEAIQTIIDQIQAIPEIKQFVKSGKFKIANPQDLKIISNNKVEFGVDYEEGSQMGVITVKK